MIDEQLLAWQIAKLLAYSWAMSRPGADKSELFVYDVDYTEEEKFMPLGKAIKVTITYVDEVDIK